MNLQHMAFRHWNVCGIVAFWVGKLYGITLTSIQITDSSLTFTLFQCFGAWNVFDYLRITIIITNYY